MTRLMMLIVVLAVVVSGACSSKPQKQFQRLAGEFVSPVHITQPVDQQSAVVGITIRSSGWVPNTEDRVYLVKVEKERDLLEGTKLIPTSIMTPSADGGEGGTVYVQNVPPGRYAAVAFSTSEKGFGKVREVTLFLLPGAMVKQTDTTVAAGGISFMGEYEMGPSSMVIEEKAADAVQAHYFEVFWGKPLVRVMDDIRVIGTPAFFAVHSVVLSRGSRDAKAEERFLAAARRDLERSWIPVIERRQATVQ